MECFNKWTCWQKKHCEYICDTKTQIIYNVKQISDKTILNFKDKQVLLILNDQESIS